MTSKDLLLRECACQWGRERNRKQSVVTGGGRGYEGNRQLLFEGTQGPGKGGFSEEVTVGLRSERERVLRGGMPVCLPAVSREGSACLISRTEEVK